MRNISVFCDRMRSVGCTELHIDMHAVTDCLDVALDGLVALASETSTLAVSLEGVRWAQFMLLLSHASNDDASRLCDSVRILLSAHRRPSGTHSNGTPSD